MAWTVILVATKEVETISWRQEVKCQHLEILWTARQCESWTRREFSFFLVKGLVLVRAIDRRIEVLGNKFLNFRCGSVIRKQERLREKWKLTHREQDAYITLFACRSTLQMHHSWIRLTLPSIVDLLCGPLNLSTKRKKYRIFQIIR